MRSSLLVSLALAAPGVLLAQSLQYRSPAGVEYRSLADTGAVARAEAAVAADPRNAERFLALGLAHASAQQYREAIDAFTRGLALDPERAEFYRWRGHRYLSVRELDRARADLERGLALDSLCYGCLYHLGIVRYVHGEFDAAAALFARGLPVAPNPGEFAGSVDWLWSSLARAGRRAEAQAVLDRHAGAITADNAYARRVLMYRKVIGPDEVVPADASGVELATRSYAVGNWYLLQGDAARARTWFERSVASGGWAAFGFIASEAELRRLR